MDDKGRLEALARMIAREIERAPARPDLRLVKPDKTAFGGSTHLSAAGRKVVCDRIRDLATLYRLDWLVRQETEGSFGSLEQLQDAELIKLRANMERARECFIDGIAFDEVGLIRNYAECD